MAVDSDVAESECGSAATSGIAVVCEALGVVRGVVDERGVVDGVVDEVVVD